MSESQKGHIGAFKGKHLSEEHKKNVSTAMIEAHITRNEETRKKIGASKRGKHYIHINGKRKLVGPDYINNVEENNE